MIRRRPPLVPLLLSLLLCGLPVRAQIIGAPPDASREQAEISRTLLESALAPPTRVTLFDQAVLRLQGGLQFVDRDIASRYLRAFRMEEPPGLVGLFLYGGRAEPWIAVMRLVRDGYVDASAIARWTPDDVLASIKDDATRDNQERARRGLPPRIVEGWRIPPRYEPDTNALVWSVRSYVPGVSSMNESDATAHIALFGRDGYFRIDIIASGATIRENARDIGLFTDNLRFVDGKQARDFVIGIDPTARQGLETVLGVSSLRPVGFLDGALEGERLMIFIVGGGLVMGAGVMATGLAMANRRRNRRA